MTLVVETGAGLITANSYATAATADAYCSTRGYAAWAGDTTTVKEPALIRATAYIDATYRLRFSGLRTFRRAQALEWPRLGAYVKYPDQNLLFVQEYGPNGYSYWNYDFIPNNIVPAEVVNATCEAALRELQVPGSLAPDLERGGAVRQLKAGSVDIRYGAAATPNTIFQAIDIALSALLVPTSPYSSRASRG